MATIVTRETTQTDGTSPKGSPLTNAEVDTNFINLNDDKVEVSGAIIFVAKAGEALSKGDVVYVSGVSGNEPVVSKADADDASKMPAYGLAEADANLNAAVNVVTFGTLYDLDTSSFAAGDTVYVSTTAGAITTTAPTGEASLLQNIGTVIRSHASAGSIKVGGAGRTNATPNLDDGNVFIGNASNQAEARALVEADITDLSLDTVTSRGSTTTNDISVGTVEFDGLSGTGAVTVTDILDQDDMSSNSATALATQQSIKAYVDAQVDTADALPEVLANGNTTGGTDISVSSGDDIIFADSSRAVFGAGSDLKIQHNGTHSYIDNTQGTLFLRNYTDDADVVVQSDNGSGGITTYFRADASAGSSILYHYGSQKIKTTSSGVEVTGAVDADTGQIAKPSTFWANEYIGINNYGGLATEGNYDLHFTVNGYRNSSGTWTSYGINSKTGAAQIALDPDGEIGFNTNASKASGSSTTVSRRMTLSDDTFDVDVDLDVAGFMQSTGEIRSGTHIIAGRQSMGATGGEVALTINDGQGNANVTFNHTSGVPDQNGNSARIVVNTDSTSSANFQFELASNVTGGTTHHTSPIFRIDEQGIEVTGETHTDTLDVTKNVASTVIATMENANVTESHVLKLTAGGAGTGTKIFECVGGAGDPFQVLGNGDVEIGGRVGIGTAGNTDQGVELHVQESDAGLVGQTGASVALFERAGNCGISIGCDGDGDTTVFFGDAANSTIGRVNYDHSTDYLSLWSANNERLTISNIGHVGIGDVSPSHRLDLRTATASGSVAVGANIVNGAANVNGSGVEIRLSGTSVTSRYAAIRAECTNDVNGHSLQFWTNSVGATPTEKMRIDHLGNAGIGVAPTAQGSYRVLELKSTHADAGGYIRLQGTDSDSRASLFNYAATMYLESEGGSFSFRDNSANVKAIISEAHITTQGAASPYLRAMSSSDNNYMAALKVNYAEEAFNLTGGQGFKILACDGYSQPNGIKFYATNDEKMRLDSSGNLMIGKTVMAASANGLAVLGESTAAATASLNVSTRNNLNNTTNILVNFRRGGTETTSGTASGAIAVNGTSQAAFVAYSDERLKENIEDLPSQLENIKSLRPREFDYKDGSGHQIGFIAQEMQQVYSDCVGEDEDGFLTIGGWNKTEARLVKAIQEQQAIIEALTQRIEQLEAN